MESENEIYETLKSMFPETDPDLILSYLIENDNDPDKTIEVLLNGEAPAMMDIPSEANPDEESDYYIAQLIQAQIYDEEAKGGAIREAEVPASKKKEAKKKEAKKEAKKVSPQEEKKENLYQSKVSFKDKLKSMFKKKKKNQETVEELDTENPNNIELTTFDAPPSVEPKGEHMGT